MRPSSQQWIYSLSQVLTPSSLPSNDYDFFEVKGLDPEKYLLAIYNKKHTDAWAFAFQDQDRPNVWLEFGHLPDVKFSDLVQSDDISSSWRNDIEVLKYGYESPVEWVRDVIKLLEGKK